MFIDEKLKEAIIRNPITSLSLLTYVGPFMLFLPVTVWIWPFIFLLSLNPVFGLSERKEFLGRDLLESWLIIAGLMLGAGVAFLVGRVFERRRDPTTPWYHYLWVPLVWLGIFLAIDIISFVVVNKILGLPVGV